MPKIGKIWIESVYVEQIKKNIVSLGIIVIHFFIILFGAPSSKKPVNRRNVGGMIECWKQRMKR